MTQKHITELEVFYHGLDILPALKDGDSYRATTRLSGVTSVGSCFYEAA